MRYNTISKKHCSWLAKSGLIGAGTPAGQIALIVSEIGGAANECGGEKPAAKLGARLANIVLRSLGLLENVGVTDIDRPLKILRAAYDIPDKPLEGLAAFTSHLASCLEAIYDNDITDITYSLAQLIIHTESFAEEFGINLNAEIRKKMRANGLNGTKGRTNSGLINEGGQSEVTGSAPDSFSVPPEIVIVIKGGGITEIRANGIENFTPTIVDKDILDEATQTANRKVLARTKNFQRIG